MSSIDVNDPAYFAKEAKGQTTPVEDGSESRINISSVSSIDVNDPTYFAKKDQAQAVPVEE